ncbi:coiled-coil domain-containing protein 137 [Syngnathoides biaculeatus]|uniref:coiled-coil domain-containing protein 137 n=1 Tax=Syngnathoides biaculeatus TaxID=300417 RepID=UPI002ADD61A6|nr:coiled-coil domain-containing protein 137 [Syngnathoides biaculeatus]
MGKNKNRQNDSREVGDKTGQPPSAKKQKRDGKAPKERKQVDHLEHIPFKLQEIMKSKERMQSGSLKAKKFKDGTLLHRMPEKSEVKDIIVPRFKRGKRESESHFVRRMEMESNHILFLTNNQAERKPELDDDGQEELSAQGKSEKKKEYDKLRLKKRQQKKLDRDEARMEKEMLQDHIPFGEVTLAPPSLTSKPKKAPARPQGAKELLLNSLLGHAPTSAAKPSLARQRIVEEERQRAVLAYRHLKKQKQQRQEEARTVKPKARQ